MLVLDATINAAQRASRVFEDNAPCTVTQARMLDAIDKLDKPSQTEIVQATGIDRSTLAEVVRRAVKGGLITRVDNKADGRAYQIGLTPLGRRKLKECRAAYARITPELLAIVNTGLLTPIGMMPDTKDVR